MMATRDGLLNALQQRFPELEFGVREPQGAIYVPPSTLWERVEQVFRGPKMRSRFGTVEVAVLSTDSINTIEPMPGLLYAEIMELVNEIRPAGIEVKLLWFVCLP